MLNDCCLFATLKHSSINSPLGIVYKNQLSPYPLILYPYSNKGLLKKFLIENRTNARQQVSMKFFCFFFKKSFRLIDCLVIIDTGVGLYGNTYW